MRGQMFWTAILVWGVVLVAFQSGTELARQDNTDDVMIIGVPEVDGEGTLPQSRENTYTHPMMFCGNQTLRGIKAVHMDNPEGIFVMIKSVLDLVNRQTWLFAVEGPCRYVSLAMDSFYGGHGLLENYSQNLFTRHDMCCVRYRRLTGNKSTKTLSTLRHFGMERTEKVLTDTVSLLQWTSVCVLYEDKQDSRKHQLLQTLDEQDIRHMVRNRRTTGLHDFLRDCMEFQVDHNIQVWVIVNNQSVNRLMYEVSVHSEYFQGLLITSRWMIWTGTLNLDAAKNLLLFKNLAILQKTSNLMKERHYRIKANFGDDQQPKFKTAVSWDASFHVHVYRDVMPYSKYRLNGVVFNVSTKEWPPFIMKNNTKYAGLCVDLLDEISQRLNFSYNFMEPSDNEWGRLQTNGAWTGMMGQLVRKDVDIMVGAISVQEEREAVADFSYPFFYDYKAIILKTRDKSLDSLDLIDPFDWVTLASMVLCVPTMALILWLCEKCHPQNMKSVVRKADKQDDFKTFGCCVLYLVGALLSEGGEDTCRTQTSRTIIAFWWMFAIVMGGVYTGNLVAARTVTPVSLPFETMKDLLNQDEYKWGIEKGAYLSMLLPKSKDDTYRELWLRIEEFNKTDDIVLSGNVSQHIEKVKRGNYAFFNDESILSLVVAKDQQQLALAKEHFLPIHFAIGFHEHSTYKDLFSKEIMAFQESGLTEAWQRRWWPKITRRSRSTSTAKPILLNEVRGIQVILFYSLLFSTSVLIIEMLYYHSMKIYRRKKAHADITDNKSAT